MSAFISKLSNRSRYIAILMMGFVLFVVGTVEAAYIRSGSSVFRSDTPQTETQRPLFIIYFEDSTQNDQAEALIRRLIEQQNLLGALGIRSGLQAPEFQSAAEAASAADSDRPAVLSQGVEFLKLLHREDINLNARIEQEFRMKSPVVIVAGGEKGGGVAQLINDLTRIFHERFQK